jgi:pyruvate dehydrogenase E1 component beta subunit
MLAALQHDGPVVLLEHKLLSESWLEFLGTGARRTVKFDVPREGAKGQVPDRWEPIPIGRAVIRRAGRDVTIASVGVGVHRALEAAQALDREGISAGVLDLRSISPLDKTALCDAVAQTGCLLVVDEDYEGFGLSGELAAVVSEAGIGYKYGRVCTRTTIPYAHPLEEQVLPSTQRICAGVRQLMQ